MYALDALRNHQSGGLTGKTFPIGSTESYW
jgi:hypothetical protein